MDKLLLSVKCESKDEVFELLSYWDTTKIRWNAGEKPTNVHFWYGNGPEYYNLYDQGERGIRIRHSSCDSYGHISCKEYLASEGVIGNVELLVDEYL